MSLLENKTLDLWPEELAQSAPELDHNNQLISL